MKITNIYNTHFNARFIDNYPVRKKNENSKEYRESEVSFIELNPFDTKDLEAIEEISENWNYVMFINEIFFNACCIANKYISDKNKIYALTEQNENFEKPDSKKILSLADVTEREKSGAHINYIEVDPSCKYKKNGEYKYLGTATLNGLKNVYDRISLNAVNYVYDFYKKNGFKANCDTNNDDTIQLIWEKQRTNK